MRLDQDKIYQGTVKGITDYGAFVEIHDEDGKPVSGMVHISEISQSYVTDIRQELTIGQEVKVKVLTQDPRVSLSIKRTLSQPERGPQGARPYRPGLQGGHPSHHNGNSGNGTGRVVGGRSQGDRPYHSGGVNNRPAQSRPQAERPQKKMPPVPPGDGYVPRQKSDDANFEAMMNRFIQTSEERNAVNRRKADHRTKSRRAKKS